jgi:hypothetical protein
MSWGSPEDELIILSGHDQKPRLIISYPSITAEAGERVEDK